MFQAFAEYEKANATAEGLGKRVNKKVMQMFEKVGAARWRQLALLAEAESRCGRFE